MPGSRALPGYVIAQQVAEAVFGAKKPVDIRHDSTSRIAGAFTRFETAQGGRAGRVKHPGPKPSPGALRVTLRPIFIAFPAAARRGVPFTGPQQRPAASYRGCRVASVGRGMNVFLGKTENSEKCPFWA
jgi:hypothetical protein